MQTNKPTRKRIECFLYDPPFSRGNTVTVD
jgi:hypothetical protein